MSSNEAPRRAVVSGSSAGIGRCIAQTLLDSGWSVSGLDVAPATLAHPAFTGYSVDLTDSGALSNAAAGLRGHDALVHAAGVLRAAPLGQLDGAAGALMWQLHVDAATLLANTLVPAMAGRGQGRVVFLGSRVAQGLPGRGQYAATKAALVALARSWAVEVAARGVTINVVSPAATATSMLLDQARAASAPRLPPIGRMIEPAEIAALVVYLLSPLAGAITGQNFTICGGASLAQ